jgi:EAL domain-containing protein (putative c-di-GMP-specific phosphodiesterase class I)
MASPTTPPRCDGCQNGDSLDFDFSMAFQPIVDLTTNRPYAYEALIRGTAGESAASVIARVKPETRYAFDQRCRTQAIKGAVAAGILGTPARLSINFLPNAVYSPRACIQLTLETARETQFPTERLIFELTENERMADPAHIKGIVEVYRQMGFGTALDDFGAGHAGLNLLASFQPDIIKLDMDLIRGLDGSLPRRMIIDSVKKLCDAMGITVIAEGIETVAELDALAALGVRYIQGYLFAKPGYECLPEIRLDHSTERRKAAG